jgi:hypothetical protein
MEKGLDRHAIETQIQAFLTREDLYLNQITLHHGAALVFHGIRSTTADIDIEVPSDVFVRLREKYEPGKIPLKFHEDLEFTHPLQFKPYLKLDCFEIFPEEVGAVTQIDDYIVYTIDAILKAKQAMNREKDQATIRGLQNYLENMYVTCLSP